MQSGHQFAAKELKLLDYATPSQRTSRTALLAMILGLFFGPIAFIVAVILANIASDVFPYTSPRFACKTSHRR